MKKLNFLIICLIMFVFLLSGCEIYESLYGEEEKEEPVYIPIEEIIIKEEVRGEATLDSIEEKVTVKVEGLEKKENYNYEAWLIDKDINLQLSIGKFDVDGGDGELIADVSKEDITDTDSVMVTKESIPDDDKGPSDVIVLQGEIPESADVIDIKLKAPEKVEEVPKEEKEIEGEVFIEEVEEKVPEEEEVVIEEVEEGPKEKAIVIIVNETELIRLKPKAYDLDKDELIYTFTSPFNEKGEWKTSYGDAGEYTITVTVSDGVLSTTKDVLIIVNKKEEPPVIESFSPESMTLTAKENSEVKFGAKITDLNKDALTYNWKLDGKDTSTEKSYTYKTSYDDAGSHTVKLIVSDGIFRTEKIWSVSVENVNRKPVLKKMSDIKVKETGTVTIKPEAEDPDGDALTYTIEEPVGNDGVWKTTYDDAGVYEVEVVVSDGVDTDSQIVKVTVENVNRPPVIEDIVLG